VAASHSEPGQGAAATSASAGTAESEATGAPGSGPSGLGPSGLGPSGPGASGQAARLPLSDRLPRPWLFPLLVFAGVWLLIVAAWSVANLVYHPSEPWSRYFVYNDGNIYEGIARYGYAWTLHNPASALRQSGWSAFFPLFPALIRLASYLTLGHYTAGGLVVVTASGAAACTEVWLLADRVCGRRAADRAVVAFALFPGAMTLGMLYSEPLGVALSAGVLLALLSRRWLLAGVLAALASAEAPGLIVLAAVAGIAALHAIWARREWRALSAPALAPLGMAAYFGYLGHRYHDYYFWFQIERRGWGAHTDWGATTLRLLTWRNPVAHTYPFYNVLVIGVFIAAMAGLAMLAAARVPLPLTLFAVLSLFLTLTSAVPSIKARLMWAAFPVFIGIGAKLPRAIYWPALALSAGVLVFALAWWPHHLAAPAP
jgi:hypothetical protein